MTLQERLRQRGATLDHRSADRIDALETALGWLAGFATRRAVPPTPSSTNKKDWRQAADYARAALVPPVKEGE